MRINRAIGLGIALLVLKLMVSEVFAAGEFALLTFFHTATAFFGGIGSPPLP